MPTEVPVIRWRQQEDRADRDVVAVEAPLEIRVNGQSLSVTMRTPGDDAALAAGFLYGEGLIQDHHDISRLDHDTDPGNPERQNTLHVTLRADKILPARGGWERGFLATSSCGVCGKTDLASVRCQALPLEDRIFRVTAEAVYGLNAQMRQKQQGFEVTGGLHAAGLFDREGNLLSLYEDVGRHNAVDKLIGTELLAERMPLSERVMMISGRASFEIMQKAAMARIPVVCAVSAPSSLAVQLAQEMHMTLIGFLRGDTMNVYAGAERIMHST